MLKGKKVVITGGTGKIGRRLAAEFACLGADVVIFYNKSKKEALKLADLVKGSIKADIAKTNDIKRAVLRAAKLLGGIDILINSAGVFYKTPIEKTTPDQFDHFTSINLRAPYFFVKFALPFLRKSGVGRVINISDIYGRSPSARYVPYGASKAGLIGMTIGLAKELAPSVLVSAVAPGIVVFNRSDRKKIKPVLRKRTVNVKNVVEAVIHFASVNKTTGKIKNV